MNRSEVMSRVRSKGTKIEAYFRDVASQAGFRLRRADSLYGKPDFRIVKTRTLIFVNSCFWHGCRRHCRMPNSRKEYWEPKIDRNVHRQREVAAELRRKGYDVLVVWEHTLRDAPERIVARLTSRTRRSPAGGRSSY